MIKKNIKTLTFIGLLASSFFSTYSKDVNLSNNDDTIVKLKGSLNTQYGHSFQKNLGSNENLTPEQKRDAIDTEASIRLEVERSAEALDYGAKIVLRTTTSASGGASANGSHIWLSNDDLGKAELGSPFSAARKMHIGAGEVDQGTGYGWQDFTFLSPTNADTDRDIFRVSDKLYTDSLKGPKNEPTRKVAYYTPLIADIIQFGVSYTPDTSNVGDNKFSNKHGFKGEKKRQILKNMFTYGVSLKNNLSEGVDLKTAFTGEYASKTGYVKDANDKITNEKLGKVRAYNIGACLTIDNWGAAGSYGSLGKSFSMYDVDFVKRNSNFYTAGISYTQGPAGVSLVHLGTNHRGNKLKSYSIATSYEFAKGLKGMVELTKFNAKGKYRVKDTKEIKHIKPKGYILTTGLTLSI